MVKAIIVNPVILFLWESLGLLCERGDGGLGISITVTAVEVLHEAKGGFCGINEPWRKVGKGSEACGPKKRPAIKRDAYQNE